MTVRTLVKEHWPHLSPFGLNLDPFLDRDGASLTVEDIAYLTGMWFFEDRYNGRVAGILLKHVPPEVGAAFRVYQALRGKVASNSVYGPYQEPIPMPFWKPIEARKTSEDFSVSCEA